MERLRADAERIAAKFDLKFTSIEAESSRVKRRYGSCHKDGRIKIRIAHARTGRPLKYSSMIDTLCHELAHLKHFNHSARFRLLYLRIQAWARQEGIYRPRPRRAPVLPEARFSEGVGVLSTPGFPAELPVRQSADRRSLQPEQLELL